MNKIIHIMTIDKFNLPFIDFVQSNFDIDKHIFIFIDKKSYEYGDINKKNTIWIDKNYKLCKLIKYLYTSEKIIVHGLWKGIFMKLLYLQPWLIKKCYHIMWGGDFYFPEKQRWLRRQILSKMTNFVTPIKSDYELVQKWYGAKGKYYESYVYPSNLYKEFTIKNKTSATINIQIGNSAALTNNHIEILNMLSKYKNYDIKLFCPLSYGGKEKYAKQVINEGKKIFAEKFIPLTTFMPFEKYLDFLSEIDIAVFNHRRQQAMGNTVTLLGLGKKVYIRNDTTTWQFFTDKDIKIYDLNDFSLDLMDSKQKQENKQKIKNYFSEEMLKSQLEKIFMEGNE